MFEEYFLINQIEKVYPLELSSVDKVSGHVEKFLTLLGTKKDTKIRVRLSVEDALLHWISHYNEPLELRLEMGSRWSRPYIMLKLWADECDPLIEADDEMSPFLGDLLDIIGLTPVYRYVNGCNLLQIPLKRRQRNPALPLLVCALVGAFCGLALDMLFSVGFKDVAVSAVLTPIQDAFFRVLNSISAPVMFLSVLTTTYNVGSISITRKGGLRIINRFLLYSTFTTTLALLFSLPLFDIGFDTSRLTWQDLSDVLYFFLDVFPGDILSPFIQGDFTQLIIVAYLLGTAFVIAGAKVKTFVTILEEANTLGLVFAEWISDLTPGLVALLILLGVQRSTIHHVLGMWKPLVAIIVFAFLALFIKMQRISKAYKVPMRVLWSKMRAPFLLSMRTASIDASYESNVNTCNNKLGISMKLTSYSLPIGLICFMPVSSIASTVLTIYAAECYKLSVSAVWLIMIIFLSVTLSAAGPPTAGIGILTYTAMFAKLLVPQQALTLVLVGDILLSFVCYPINQAMLQLELIRSADKMGLLNRKVLQKP